jgi:cytochrome o ubiquinol oxidase operon protein cyoD
MDHAHGSLRSYVIGFILSLIFTLAAFVAVTHHAGAMWVVAAIIVLAFLQLLTQLIFFLHLARESKPYFNLYILIFFLVGVGIVVGGSLWIMYHLNYSMTSQQMENYLIKDEGIQK